MIASVRFLDGPAEGQTMQLTRAPILLRVVESETPDGPEFEALDRLDDTPRPHETIHVYRMWGQTSYGFIDYRDKQGRRQGDRLVSAEYELYDQQPDDADARYTPNWQAWTEQQRPRVARQPPPQEPTDEQAGDRNHSDARP